MFTSFMLTSWMQGIAIGALTPSMAVGTVAVMAPLQSEWNEHAVFLCYFACVSLYS
jgi:hypothetical protein